MLSCYSALSSHILTTNHLIPFLMLHSRYPVLQSINNYHSLIGAIYVFRLYALFSPRISSPSFSLYYLHVFPISRNCLAPPHFPESLHRAFIPQCTYSPHQSLVPCEFLLSTYFILTFCAVISVIVLCCIYSCFLFPGSFLGLACFPCPCPCPVSLVFIFFISLCLLVFLVLILWLLLPVFVLSCVLFMFGLPVVLTVILTFWF